MILPLLVATASAGQVRHAVVVGANDGGGVLEPLHYAESDAQRMGEVLVELGDFDEELVTVLYRPSEEQLREALAAHAAIAEKYDDDLFLFYYSGHADASGLRLGDDRYFFEGLKHDLRSVDANVRVGVLDACRSGTITRLKGAVVTESILGVDDGVAEGEAWLTASAEDELAQESESLRGGFFTHYLVSGMRGAADTGDGVVDLTELQRYTQDRVVEATGRTDAGAQHPSFKFDLAGSSMVPLTDVRNASALLVLQEHDAGQIAVFRLPDKAELAEFHKTPDHEMSIAVPPGRYLVRRRYDDATYEATFGISEGARFRVEQWGSPTLQGGTARGVGDPRVSELIDASRAWKEDQRLGSSPALAGSASLVIPGAGQIYNQQVWKGLAYFGATSGLLAGLVWNPTDDQIATAFWPMLGAGVWGAAVADATYNVHRREEHRPRLGGQLSLSAVQGGGDWPTHVGMSGDLMLAKGLSIGLDRVGYTWGTDGRWDLNAGSRVIVAGEGERWRPYVLLALGARHGRAPSLDGADRVLVTRTTLAGGGGLRYYVVPRYFLEVDARFESAGDWTGFSGSTGFGVHLGR